MYTVFIQMWYRYINHTPGHTLCKDIWIGTQHTPTPHILTHAVCVTCLNKHVSRPHLDAHKAQSTLHIWIHTEHRCVVHPVYRCVVYKVCIQMCVRHGVYPQICIELGVYPDVL